MTSRPLVRTRFVSVMFGMLLTSLGEARSVPQSARCSANQLTAGARACAHLYACRAQEALAPAKTVASCSIRPGGAFAGTWRKSLAAAKGVGQPCTFDADPVDVFARLRETVLQAPTIDAGSNRTTVGARRRAARLLRRTGRLCADLLGLAARSAFRQDAATFLRKAPRRVSAFDAKAARLRRELEEDGFSITLPWGQALGATVAEIARARLTAVCFAPPCLFIDGIASAQFSGEPQNFLPGSAGVQGNRLSRVLMGTRSDGVAHARATIRILPDDRPLPVSTQVRLEGAVGTPIGTGILAGATASLNAVVDELDGVGGPTAHRVLAWLDDDGDGQPSAGEHATMSADHFVIVTPRQYTLFRQELLFALGIQYLVDTPRAGAFARAFLSGDPIVLEGVENLDAARTLESIEPELLASLSYRVGFVPSPAGNHIRDFMFDDSSSLADAIRHSDTMALLVRAVINRSTPRDVERLASDSVRLRWPLQPAIDYAASTPVVPSLDSDLFFTFGKAVLAGDIEASGTCRNDTFIASDLSLTGRQIDLYDWNYTPGLPLGVDSRMALVQAGYDTLGRGGSIFRTEVQLDGSLPLSGALTVPLACPTTSTTLGTSTTTVPSSTTSTTQPTCSDLSGCWSGTADVFTFVVNIRESGTHLELSGSFGGVPGTGSGELNCPNLVFGFGLVGGVSGTFTGALAADRTCASGTFSSDVLDGQWSACRCPS